MSKEAIKLARVLEALVPFEKLFMQTDEKDMLGGQNIDCQIATTDLRKLAYAAADLREALAEQPAQQQEPVAWIEHEWSGTGLRHLHFEKREPAVRDEVVNPVWTPLYTSPPASKPWVGLEPQDFDGVIKSDAFEAGAYWANNILREKNA